MLLLETKQLEVHGTLPSSAVVSGHAGLQEHHVQVGNGVHRRGNNGGTGEPSSQPETKVCSHFQTKCTRNVDKYADTLFV